MTQPRLYPRYARPRLVEALADTPVVLLHGPRQSGKTTLAQIVGDAGGYAYITFDDDVQLAAAISDPVGFVADLPGKFVLDEVQRAPSLFCRADPGVMGNERIVLRHRTMGIDTVREQEIYALRSLHQGDFRVFQRRSGYRTAPGDPARRGSRRVSGRRG